MNTERLAKIAAWLEAGAKHSTMVFNMSSGLVVTNVSTFDRSKPTECQTSCCIAGAAVQFFGDMEQMSNSAALRSGDAETGAKELSWYEVSDQAADLLGLSAGDDRALFVPSLRFGGDLPDYNDPAWAARTIRHLIATGEVDWNATREAEVSA